MFVRLNFIAILLMLSGCGYTLNHRLKETFAKAKAVYVPVFTNNTDETGAEVIFTNALIRELESRGEVVVTGRRKEALELRGTVASISYSPTASTPFAYQGLTSYRRLPIEIGVGVSISLQLVDPKKGAVLWSNAFSGYRRVATPVDRTFDYQAPSALGLVTQSLIESQYSDIAGDIMRDVYDDMVELF